MHKYVPRLCILGCVFLALLSPATAYCGETGSGPQDCQAIQVTKSKTLDCGVGKDKGIHYSSGDKRFDGADFAKSCLVDAAVTCHSTANTGQPGNFSTSCCSCYLYNSYCHGQSEKFVTHKPHSDHTLLMPSSACTGIENYDRPGCPGETIWDEGHSRLTAAGTTTWGMGINPVGRRGQHQMHVHLAEVHKSLRDAIVMGVASNHDNFWVNCGLGTDKYRVTDCKNVTKSCKDCPEVLIKQGDIKKVAPFRTVYGPYTQLDKEKVLHASTLVWKLPKSTDTWAVVFNYHGPAECFFASAPNTELEKACPK